MLEHEFDCLAIPLPPSFQEDVQRGIDLLPMPTVVTQRASEGFDIGWTPEDDETSESSDSRVSYVPIDPCQPVIAGIRIAMGEHIPCHFIDLETADFHAVSASLPDAFALKQLPVERFSAAILPFLQRIPDGQVTARIRHMAARLRELEQNYKSVLLVCSILHWPWIREAYTERLETKIEDDYVAESELYQADPRTLLFMFGELPFVTGLYERARFELDDDDDLQIDGVKELLIAVLNL